MSIDIAKLTGRDLDAAVAEWVLGYRREPIGKDAHGANAGGEVLVRPGMTNDQLAYALPPLGGVPLAYFVRQFHEDVEESIHLLESRFPWPRYYTRLCRTERGNWRCDIELHAGDGPVICASQPTIPLAICHAAILVTRKERGL